MIKLTSVYLYKRVFAYTDKAFAIRHNSKLDILSETYDQADTYLSDIRSESSTGNVTCDIRNDDPAMSASKKEKRMNVRKRMSSSDDMDREGKTPIYSSLSISDFESSDHPVSVVGVIAVDFNYFFNFSQTAVGVNVL